MLILIAYVNKPTHSKCKQSISTNRHNIKIIIRYSNCKYLINLKTIINHMDYQKYSINELCSSRILASMRIRFGYHKKRIESIGEQKCILQ